MSVVQRRDYHLLSPSSSHRGANSRRAAGGPSPWHAPVAPAIQPVVVPSATGRIDRDWVQLLVCQQDEGAARVAMTEDEAARRLPMLQRLCDRFLGVIGRSSQARREDLSSHTGSAPSGGARDWTVETRRAFADAEKAHAEQRDATYSPYSTTWMPHDKIRTLHGEWVKYFARCRQMAASRAALFNGSSSSSRGAAHATARALFPPSSLMSSYFTTMLIDPTTTDTAVACRVSRDIIDACVEVINDAEDGVDGGRGQDAASGDERDGPFESLDDAPGVDGPPRASSYGVPRRLYLDAVAVCPYQLFTQLIRSVAEILFPGKHPFMAVHLTAVVLCERVNRLA